MPTPDLHGRHATTKRMASCKSSSCCGGGSAPPPAALKTAFITGTSSGIGRALAEELASEHGFRVYAGARRVESLASLCEANPGRIVPVRVDVLDASSLEKAVAECVAACGTIDLCIANAGSLTVNPLVEQGIDEVRSTFDTNVIGVINTIRVAAPPMMSHGAGTIAVTGSITADYPTPFGAVYCASKAAVESLCRSVRSELSPFGIHVVHLYTGAVSTDISSNAKKTVPPPPTVDVIRWLHSHGVVLSATDYFHCKVRGHAEAAAWLRSVGVPRGPLLLPPPRLQASDQAVRMRPPVARAPARRPRRVPDVPGSRSSSSRAGQPRALPPARRGHAGRGAGDAVWCSGRRFRGAAAPAAAAGAGP